MTLRGPNGLSTEQELQHQNSQNSDRDRAHEANTQCGLHVSMQRRATAGVWGPEIGGLTMNGKY